MITPSQASAIAELLRDCERALDPDRPHGADVLRLLRDDLRDWARDLDGLVREAPIATLAGRPVYPSDIGDTVTISDEGPVFTRRLPIAEQGVDLLSLCPHCSDPLCDDRCKETR